MDTDIGHKCREVCLTWNWKLVLHLWMLLSFFSIHHTSCFFVKDCSRYMQTHHIMICVVWIDSITTSQSVHDSWILSGTWSSMVHMSAPVFWPCGMSIALFQASNSDREAQTYLLIKPLRILKIQIIEFLVWSPTNGCMYLTCLSQMIWFSSNSALLLVS